MPNLIEPGNPVAASGRVAILAVLLGLWLPTAAAQTGGSRLEFVNKLLVESSAAKRVDASSNPEATAKRDEARAAYQKAVAAERRGDQAGMEQSLKEATRAMMEAARLAEREGSAFMTEKKDTDYRNRLESVRALLAALERVQQEKKQPDAAKLRDLQRKLEQSQAAHAQGRADEARSLLDDTYVAAKVAIEAVRGGDVLVRSLQFATKEEEYKYEVDRNDTHKMLVTVLLKEKIEQAPDIQRMVQPLVEQAAALRQEAERRAAHGDFAAAIRSLEDSTQQLVRAIRSAGIFIPG